MILVAVCLCICMPVQPLKLYIFITPLIMNLYAIMLSHISGIFDCELPVYLLYEHSDYNLKYNDHH